MFMIKIIKQIIKETLAAMIYLIPLVIMLELKDLYFRKAISIVFYFCFVIAVHIYIKVFNKINEKNCNNCIHKNNCEHRKKINKENCDIIFCSDYE